MISSDIFPVYAQYNEDIILAALLDGVTKGFYIDVGANHEKYHSVTKYFYDRGWSGVNIEPIPRLMEEIKAGRPRDTNLQIAISSKPGEMKFREYPEHDGFSTLSDDTKADPTKQDIPHKDYIIKVETLAHVFSSQNIKRADFLKIDVEGYEFEVLKSNDWKKYRPTVIAIEANHRADDWSEYLTGQNYDRVIFDGLNEYYVDRPRRHIFDGFAERAALLAHSAIRHHQLDLWHADIDRMKELDDMTKRQDALIQQLQQDAAARQREIERLGRHSLADKSYLKRLKIAGYNLSVGYVKGKLPK